MKDKSNKVSCKDCGKKIKDGEGRVNSAKGSQCMVCYEKPQLIPVYTKIAGYQIPTKILNDWKDASEYIRHSAIMGKALDNPIWITRALQARVDVHKKIFKITGHDHESTEPEPMKIRRALEKWLEENTMIHVPKGSLL